MVSGIRIEKINVLLQVDGVYHRLKAKNKIYANKPQIAHSTRDDDDYGVLDITCGLDQNIRQPPNNRNYKHI